MTLNMTNNKIHFAVIILVYNTEKYIGACLDSLKNQTYNDWEAICVDDCSTDGSLDILNRYAEEDSRIKVYRSPRNQGISKNRNFAISKITPDQNTWIYSIDSDDYISPSMFEFLVSAISNSTVNVDVVRLNFQRTTMLYSENDDAHTLISPQSVHFDIVSRDKYFSEYEVGGYTCSACVNSMLVDRHNIRYPENQLILEDQVFSIPCFAFAENLIVVEHPFYYYYNNPTSNGKKLGGRRKYDAIRLINNLYPVLIDLSDATRHYVFNEFLPSRLAMYLSMSLYSQKGDGGPKESLHPSIKLFSNLRGVKPRIKYLVLLLTGKL